MSLIRRKPLLRKSPLLRKTQLKGNPEKTAAWIQRTRKPLPKKGKKMKKWEKTRDSLKDAFKRAGITTCELRFRYCWVDNALGFAHSKKRRNITTNEELQEVILACNTCHNRIERKPEAEMGAIVRGVINARNIAVIIPCHKGEQ